MPRWSCDAKALQGDVLTSWNAVKDGLATDTAVLLFTKTNSGGTDHAWFHELSADGYSSAPGSLHPPIPAFTPSPFG